MYELKMGMAPPPNGPLPEIVLQPGMRVDAKTSRGEIIIEARAGFERAYTWEGAERKVSLWPRWQRWSGALGLYYPGPGNHWKEHNGITRGVLEEGVLWFQTEDDAQRWIIEQKSMGFGVVYSNQGVLVALDKTLERKQLSVELYQIMVGGTKPHTLKGSDDQSINISTGWLNPAR